MEARRDYDFVIGPMLLRIFEERIWAELGYRSFAEYVTDRLGKSGRSARQRLWLERRLCGLPEIRDALADGRLTYTKALIVAKDATPDVVERPVRIG